MVVAESAPIGGTCVNAGCVPKKLYSYAAQLGEAIVDARGFGWELHPPVLNWAALKSARACEIRRLNGVYWDLLRSSGVQVERGWARLLDEQTVEVLFNDGLRRRFRAAHVVIASGGQPSLPPICGIEHALTSDSIFDVEPFPRRLAVIGGGYIACEFASIFNGLGSSVDLLCRGSQILRGFDEDVRARLATEMRSRGVNLQTEVTAEVVEKTAQGLTLHLCDGMRLECDAVLCAVGRRARTEGLGLVEAGVAVDSRGAVLVDEAMRTTASNIYAIGDVTGRMQLTPVALAEAMVVVDRLYGTGRRTMDYSQIPSAVFTQPNVARVGLTEVEARAVFTSVKVFRSEFKALKHALSGRAEKTLMKLVVDAETDRLLGVHMVGPEAGEIVQGFVAALKAGATKQVLDSAIGIHPTVAEEFMSMRQSVS